jgi:L-alanine-DL-glutamate epimerase-like enolase superfamily enzyme
MSGQIPRTADELTSYRLEMIEQTLKAISDNLSQLATLEHKHIETREALDRAFSSVEKIDGRVKHIEIEMPTLKLVRGWVISGAVGIIGLLAITLFKLFTVVPVA